MPQLEKDELSVLYIDQTPTHGGSVESLSRLVKALSEGRVRPVIVTAHGRRKRDIFPGMRTEVVPRRPSFLSGSRSFRKVSASGGGIMTKAALLVKVPAFVLDLLTLELPRFLRLVRLGRSSGAKLVHLNNGLGDTAGIFAAKWLGVPCVSHHRDFKWKSSFSRWLSGWIDHHIAISEEIRRDLLNLGVDGSRISVLNDPVSSDEFHPALDINPLIREFERKGKEKFFGIFGRIVKWKGHEVFLEAAAEVLRRVPESRAFIVGDTADGPGEFLRQLKARAWELDISPKVVFTGFRRDVGSMMKLMDVVVHASIRPEPFGMVVAEAMATGRPVVATLGGGILDILEHEKEGLLVPMGDAPKMAEAVIRLLQDDALRASMGKKGAERAEKKFSVEGAAGRLDGVYRLVLREKVV